MLGSADNDSTHDNRDRFATMHKPVQLMSRDPTIPDGACNTTVEKRYTMIRLAARVFLVVSIQGVCCNQNDNELERVERIVVTCAVKLSQRLAMLCQGIYPCAKYHILCGLHIATFQESHVFQAAAGIVVAYGLELAHISE
jgi:hypothetical protein